MRIFAALAIVFSLTSLASATGVLEVPSDRASGISIVSGWKCPPVGNLTVEFNGGEAIPLAKGISRKDTSSICGNSGLNGFIAQYNYNLLGTGRHTAVVRDNGVEFDRHEFDVQTFGTTFLQGGAGGAAVGGFPTAGTSTTVVWDQGTQNFVIIDVEPPGSNVIFSETFENGEGLWFSDNGVWQIGTPSFDPVGCFEGSGCGSTNLAGNYPDQTGSRLVSPGISLPNVLPGQELQLRFADWHSYADCSLNYHDVGVVQVQTYDFAASQWSSWEDVPGSLVECSSQNWVTKAVSLTQWAGERIRIGFGTFSGFSANASGWTIDNVQLLRIP